jgi:hypothetical protein
LNGDERGIVASKHYLSEPGRLDEIAAQRFFMARRTGFIAAGAAPSRHVPAMATRTKLALR